MQFRELKITDFGKFHQKNLSFKEGINLIYGENEAGKSTIHAFLRGMLFGIDKPRGRAGKEDMYTKYQPWDNPSLYRGSLDFISGGKPYRIIRNFDKNNKSTTLLDLETGRELDGESDRIRKLLGGLTESGYQNTISIEQQKIRTSTELAGEVRNYITNLSLTGSNEVDINKAIAFLQGKKKELENKRPLQELKETRESIEKGIALEQRANHLVQRINSTTKALLFTEEKCRKAEERKAASLDYDYLLLRYPIMEEKLSDYEDIREQKKELQKLIDSINRELQYGNDTGGGSITSNLEVLKPTGIIADKEISGNQEIAANTETEGNRERLGSKILKEALDTVRLYERQGDELEKEKNRLLSSISGNKNSNSMNSIPTVSMAIAGILLLLLGVLVNNPLLMGGILFLPAAVVVYCRKKLKYKEEEKVIKEDQAKIDSLLLQNQSKRKSILLTYKVQKEAELEALYEELLKKEIESNYKEVQQRDYIKQVNRLKEREGELREELINYLKLFPADYEEGGENSNLCMKNLIRVKNYIEKKQNEERGQRSELNLERDGLRLVLEQLKWELNTLTGNEEELLLYQEKEKELIEKEEELRVELEAIMVAMDTIKSLSLQIHDSFGSVLNRQVSRIAADITENKYSKLSINENLDIKAEIAEEFRAFDRLSTGTMEQLFFALRLSVSDILYDKGLPLLLDDCFAYYDDKRTAAAITYLAESDRQILLFTCHNREKNILEERNIPYNFVNLMEL